jgi:hypothetical protein
MAKVSETYAGAYVTGAELQPLGLRRSALIHQAVQEVVGQENATPKIVLDLVSKQGQPWPRRVVLNKTNALQLAAAFGDDTDDWVGKTVEIWGEMVMFKGKATPGIRLAAAGSAQPGGRTAGHAVPAITNAPIGEGADDEIPY